jgi:uncharacterized protein (TIGR00251 family)
MIEIVEREHGVSFMVRVQPRSRRDEIAGERAGVLKVRLSAAPIEGRANEALCDFLSSVLKISKSAVRILSGERSRSKLVEIRGVSVEQIRSLLIHEA